jgi:hypothetical protein
MKDCTNFGLPEMLTIVKRFCDMHLSALYFSFGFKYILVEGYHVAFSTSPVACFCETFLGISYKRGDRANFVKTLQEVNEETSQKPILFQLRLHRF